MSNNSLISGTVVDQDGNDLPSVEIQIVGENLENNLILTNEEGKFEIRDLSPGQFMLTASMIGYMNSNKNVFLNEGQDFSVRMTMYLESDH